MGINTLFIFVSVVLFVLVALGVLPNDHLLYWGLASFAMGHLPLDSYVGRTVAK